jgi:hypothetical protein
MFAIPVPSVDNEPFCKGIPGEVEIIQYARLYEGGKIRGNLPLKKTKHTRACIRTDAGHMTGMMDG